MDVALVLTRDCNLGCGYCYAGDKVKARMPDDVAERALDLALDAAHARGEPLEIQLFGGEPLLEWNAVVRVATRARERAAERGIRIALQLTTNGTLLDADRVRALAALGVHVALSLDGTERAQNASRPTRGGGPSYAAASAALDHLLASGRPFDVITVVSPETVGDLAPGVRALLDRGVDRLTLNPSWSSPWTDAELAVLEAQLVEIAALVVAWFRRGRAVAVQPFDSAIVARATGGPRGSLGAGCGAGVSSFAIAPSGRIHGCARAVGEDDPARAIGHLDGGLDADRVAARTSPCAGSCACANLEETGDARERGRVQRFVVDVVDRLAGRIADALAIEPVGHATFQRTFSPRPASSSASNISEVP